MNYRHIYHAGNFADIFKHFLCFFIAKQFHKKEAKVLYLDAFAGPALYSLSSTEALKTNEYKDGIERFINASFTNSNLIEFQNFLKPSWGRQLYKGSPLLLQSFLRPQDRLIVNELHPDDFLSLKKNMNSYANVTCTNLDAYISIKSAIPPQEKRGFILIDPPFEKRDEFDLLIKNIQLWHKKFPQGVYAIWYPIKANDMSRDLSLAAQEIGFHRTYCFEFLKQPRETEGALNGCGMLVFNTPFLIPELMTDARLEFDQCLGGQTSLDLLTTD